MTPRTILLAVTIGVLVAFAARASELPYQPGESLTLRVHYLAMNVADLDITVNDLDLDGRRVWPLELHGETKGLFGSLHDFDETFVSYVDPANGANAGWDKLSVDAGVTEQERVRYVPAGAKVRRVRGTAVTNGTKPVPEGARDILAAIYHLRAQPLTPGSETTVPVFTGRESWDLSAKVTGRETIEVGGKAWDTVKVQLRTHFVGKFASDREVNVWFSADARHVPVKIEADFFVGTMRATLERYTGGELARN